VWLGIVGLAFALCALSFCVYLWLDSRDKVSRKDIPSLLKASSEELSETYAKSFRSLEAEWLDMYSKFQRLAGRMDKTKALDGPIQIAPEPAPIRRSDLLRRMNGRKHHVEDVSTQ